MAADSPGDSEQLIRDRLALQRTRLANERTLLAYARTSIMLAATGGTLLTLYGESGFPVTSGWALIAAGIIVVANGGVPISKTCPYSPMR